MSLRQELIESGIPYKEVTIRLLLRPKDNAPLQPYDVQGLQANVFGNGDVVLYTCPVTNTEQFAAVVPTKT